MPDKLLARCTHDPISRALWLGFEESPVRVKVRFRVYRRLPHQFADLHGETVDLLQFRSMLPPMTVSDFHAASQTLPELRADVDDWCVSVIIPQDLAPSRAQAFDLLVGWVRNHWA